MRLLLSALLAGLLAHAAIAELEKARDRQDRATLERFASQAASTAKTKPNDPDAQYRAALAHSYLAEVAIEQHDKARATTAAENGIEAAQRAVALKAESAEYNRVLGTLCGQAISSAGFMGIRYGRCALDSVNKAIELNPNDAENYVSHGVGMFYLPAAFGGGVELAIKDFRKALELNPKSTDAWIWLGVALRKQNHDAEARQAFQKALAIDPDRLWARQQLEKTPSAP
ncbi:MAG TPA: tetratricopeptide repeat protein [Bryobacteraceae bacterium]|nr:tetratricopeptide repeat protein [Bryobacteraceae bacterium]